MSRVAGLALSLDPQLEEPLPLIMQSSKKNRQVIDVYTPRFLEAFLDIILFLNKVTVGTDHASQVLTTRRNKVDHERGRMYLLRCTSLTLDPHPAYKLKLRPVRNLLLRAKPQSQCQYYSISITTSACALRCVDKGDRDRCNSKAP